MVERFNPLKFTYVKRFIVIAEITIGSFLLAWVTAILFQFSTGMQAAPDSDLNALTRTIVILLIIGTVLFLDGLRHGRRWW